ncbi:hypothetical protein GCM10022268_28940 [Sphingomonas cynarae]|uniref:Uncharacterized protein n=1 Tax=Sphingomonas cynarae TaxID=930197 RepID=A0ABP7EI27_9SPHN
MIAAVALAVMVQLSPDPEPSPGAPPAILVPPPVAEWPMLPTYPLPRTASIADGVGFVRDEVEAGRCHPQLPPPEDENLQLPVAILVGRAGQVRQIVPRAIGCPSVEQYVVGYLLSLTRTGIESSVSLPAGWYQLTAGYRW